MSQSYLKASIDGLNGSGKTGTAARLAVGISIEYCNRAPVVVADSEERWRFLKPTMFDIEKVPVIIVPGQTLVGVHRSFEIAKKEGAGVWVADQLTTPWMEGIREFSFSDGELSFARRQQLMNQWEPVVSNFRYGPFHCIGIGRLGWQWSNIEDENGNMKLVQGDSKFNAGGGSNFGYEADLELEMRRRKVLSSIIKKIVRGGKTKASVEHICDVVKDAASGIINGQQFTFESTQGLYKAGDYKTVLKAFRPYIDFMRTIPGAEQPGASSRELLVSGKTPWAAEQTEKTALLEEIAANLDFCFPSGEGKSKLAKMFRDLTMEYLNGYISWSRMEEEVPVAGLMQHLKIIKAMRARIEAKQLPTDQTSLHVLLRISKEDVRGGPGKDMTLLEAMGLASVEATKGKRGPQPIVKVAEQERADELAGD